MTFDNDQRKAREIVKSNPDAFNEYNTMAVMDAIGAIENALLDARIEERMIHTNETKEVAESHVVAYLKGTEK